VEIHCSTSSVVILLDLTNDHDKYGNTFLFVSIPTSLCQETHVPLIRMYPGSVVQTTIRLSLNSLMSILGGQPPLSPRFGQRMNDTKALSRRAVMKNQS
jgi:hypothetical protein